MLASGDLSYIGFSATCVYITNYYSTANIVSLTALNVYLVGGLYNTRVLNVIINTMTIIISSPPMTPPITAPTGVVPLLKAK